MFKVNQDKLLLADQFNMLDIFTWMLVIHEI